MLRLFLAFIFLAIPLSCSPPRDPAGPVPSPTTYSTLRPPTPTAYPFTGKLVQLAWFFKPPNQIPIESLPSSFDFFILTHKDEADRDRLRASGRDGPILQYLLLAEIMDPGDCTSDASGNQVAYKPGDFCEISQQHPDWFLLDQSGNRIRGRNGKYYMDPGNEGYRSFWIERSRMLQADFGWQGLFIDNVEASRAKFTTRGISLAAYPDDSSYQSAVAGFLALIERTYTPPQHTTIVANIVSVASNVTWDRYIGYLDGAMIESFATSRSDGPLPLSDWTQQMSLAENALAKGMTLILVSQGKQPDYELQRFAFASYLLINNGKAVFRYANADSYREAWMYPDYNVELGIPLGSRYQVGDAWRRDFTHGHVLVDPRTDHVEIVVSP